MYLALSLLMNIWVASDCLDFCHCCHSPVTRPLCALGTLLQAEMWNCCGDGFGHFTFLQAFPDHTLQTSWWIPYLPTVKSIHCHQYCLICISLMINEAEPVVIHLLAICSSSEVNRLFWTIIHFFFWVVCFLLIICMDSLNNPEY